MPSRIAQRSRKTAKKTSKRVVLYVPDTFDPEIHLPEELRHLADYARYLLHRINVGRVHLRRGNNLVYLKRDYLVEFIPKDRFTAIRDALVGVGRDPRPQVLRQGRDVLRVSASLSPQPGLLALPTNHEAVDRQASEVEKAGVRYASPSCPSRIEALCQSDHDRRTSSPHLGSRHTVSAGRLRSP